MGINISPLHSGGTIHKILESEFVPIQSKQCYGGQAAMLEDLAYNQSSTSSQRWLTRLRLGPQTTGVPSHQTMH